MHAEKFLVSPINEEDVEDKEATIEEYTERINNNVTILERCDHEWGILLSKLKVEEKVMEEKEHAQVAEGTEGYIETLMNAGEIITQFKGRLKCIRCKSRAEPAKCNA